MAHCVICRKDFASSASLRTHRSKFHRADTEMEVENQETDQTNNQETNQTNSQETNQTNSQNTNQTDSQNTDQTNSQNTNQTDSQNTDQTNSQDTLDEEDTLVGKRKHEDIENDPHFPKNRHVYKKLSGIHDILKHHLEDTKKEFNFLSCYTIKEMLDNIVPQVFGNELTMQEKLTNEQLRYVTMITELQNLPDVHMVLNEAESRETLLDILKITDIERIIKSHHRALKMVSNSTRRNFDAALRNTPSLATAIKVLFSYILDGTLKMKPHHVKKLKPHRDYIRKIAHEPRGKAVVQKGGSLLGTILSTIVPLIPAIL